MLEIFPKKYVENPLGSTLYVHVSISIIRFKGAWIVPSIKEINLQTRLRPLLEFPNRIILARLVASGEKTRILCG